VGRNIRGILHRLGEALAFFEDQKIYLVSQAANDLNFTFVVDEQQADRLVEQLHALLIHPERGDKVLGPTWEELFRQPTTPTAPADLWWWQRESAQLLSLLGTREAAYVYHLPTVRAAATALTGLSAVERVHYVSLAELEHVLRLLPGIDPGRILFTPNFAPRTEYVRAFELGVSVTIDNLYALQHWPELFADRQVLVRVDTGTGRGHHQHVRTAGTYAKFGVPTDELAELARLARSARARIIGLHAHTGSGIFDIQNWVHTARALAQVASNFPHVGVLNIGGGFGVPDANHRESVDLAALDQALRVVKAEYPQFALWIEPGRYLVAVSGVLLARVTQLKQKGEQGYVGIATGMNALIRPALYGAFHEIVNLSRPGEDTAGNYDVVGPICETGDVLGHDRRLPETRENDVLLVANAGAYGRSMASNYNLRAPPEELILD
jgi:diaminopimelate decarboxylase/aspartate kinase